MQIKNKYILFILIALIGSINELKGNENSLINQNILINYSCKNKSIKKIFDDFKKEYQLNFQYNPADLKKKTATVELKEVPLKKALNEILNKTNLLYKVNAREIIIYKNKDSDLSHSTENIKVTVSGYITDAETTESLIGATIVDETTGLGTVTNEYGFFSITLPKGDYILKASYLGYKNHTKNYQLLKDASVEIQLSSSSAVINEVVITSESESVSNFEKTQMSQLTIPVAQLKSMPVILGEEDLMKSIQLLPGVKSGSEGTSGIFIRGGSEDQNLILLDGVPVYNPAHALGIFSVFNPDAIKSLSLINGGHPARYGGRLSSIIDIRMKEGNLEKWHGDASIGLISSKLSLSGPIIKDKISILASARRTYADLILKPLFPQENDQNIDPSFFFHDYNAKMQYRINDRHRIYLSAYFGKDKFGAVFEDSISVQKSLINWGNNISAMRWNYKINKKLFANTTLTYSDYNITTENSQEGFIDTTLNASFYSSGILDLGAKIDFDYLPSPDHYIKFGLGIVRHEYNPGINQNINTQGEEPGNGNNAKVAGIEAFETDIYIEDEIKMGRLSANLGIHASLFAVENKTYNSVQPRLGFRYLINNGLSIKASYSTMTQYINLLTSEALSLPSDIWVPSTNRILPQDSWQAGLGLGGKISNKFEWEVEGYYKSMDNVISYQEGTSFVDRDPRNWENQITQGSGESYGGEVFIQKTEGKLTGIVSYTLSWSNRQFEDINNGEKFPFRFDRRHDFSTALVYQVSDKIKLSANWVFSTGNAVSVPKFTYPAQFPTRGNPIIVEDGGSKNSFRMSPSHRLDWSISFIKQKRKYQRTWVIGFYNTYFNKNPFYLQVESEGIFDKNGNILGTKYNLNERSLLPIIPSVSYQIKF